MLGGADNPNGELPSYITGADSLAGQPYKGRNGRVEGTRELVIHPHFVLVYEVDSQWGKVYILRVLHTAQKWP
ncbi:type II toxin-antitoxin system RelE/ParE family toxin [Escherichia coli]|uniref:type II toxin-antitoxin system RelE/ParE family toxin n=1 Tax=Escherichia coli TaxID=562 RepID=UPI0028AFA9D8|nr:type II toxin-antitoxin system RelE/ParE family toxin [Escherichia coli]